MMKKKKKNNKHRFIDYMGIDADDGHFMTLKCKATLLDVYTDMRCRAKGFRDAKPGDHFEFSVEIKPVGTTTDGRQKSVKVKVYNKSAEEIGYHSMNNLGKYLNCFIWKEWSY